MKWQASPEVDEDLIEGRDYIRGDNDVAARAFLNTAFETFDLLGDYPEMGPRTRLRSKKLRDLRFFVMPPPFNRWIVFIASRITALGSSASCTGALTGDRSRNGFSDCLVMIKSPATAS